MSRHPLPGARILFLSAFPFCALLVLSVSVNCRAQDSPPGTYVSFDAPHASYYGGTYPTAINRWGSIGMFALTNDRAEIAYIREPDGQFVRVFPPGATNTYLSAINSRGQTVGSFSDSSKKQHGFLRDPKGSYLVVNPPQATGGTILTGINEAGQASGSFVDAGGTHGFYWDSAYPKDFTVIEISGSTSTAAVAINASGYITGYYVDKDGNDQGFVRDPDGAITTFDAGTDTTPIAINSSGVIMGTEFDPASVTGGGFLRNAHGEITLFATQDEADNGIAPTAINDNGIVVGYNYTEAFGNFAWENSQLLTLPFDTFDGSTATGINSGGHVIGTYIDSKGRTHGWVN